MQGARMGCPLGEHKNFVTVQPDSPSKRWTNHGSYMLFQLRSPGLASCTDFSCVIMWSHALSSAGSHSAEPGHGSRSIRDAWISRPLASCPSVMSPLFRSRTFLGVWLISLDELGLLCRSVVQTTEELWEKQVPERYHLHGPLAGTAWHGNALQQMRRYVDHPDPDIFENIIAAASPGGSSGRKVDCT